MTAMRARGEDWYFMPLLGGLIVPPVWVGRALLEVLVDWVGPVLLLLGADVVEELVWLEDADEDEDVEVGGLELEELDAGPAPWNWNCIDQLGLPPSMISKAYRSVGRVAGGVQVNLVPETPVAMVKTSFRSPLTPFLSLRSTVGETWPNHSMVKGLPA
jgi:hypothetical protein